MKKFINLLFIFLLVISQSVFAETVLLKDGSSMKGKVVSQKKDTVIVNVNGKNETIAKKNILKIVYKDLEKHEEEKIRKEEEAKPATDDTKTETSKVDFDRSFYSQPAKFDNYTGLQTMGYSLMLPGLGHYKVGQKGWGHTYTVLFYTTLTYASYQFNKYNLAKAEYDPASHYTSLLFFSFFGGSSPAGLMLGLSNFNYYNNQLANIQNLKGQYEQALNLMILVYLFQAGHAYFDGNNTDGISSWSFSVQPSREGSSQASMGYTFRF